jgi:hypothetical protein
LFVGPFNTSQDESQTVGHKGSILREVKGYLPVQIPDSKELDCKILDRLGLAGLFRL